MTDLFDNPLGLDGFEFLEFSAPEKGVLEDAFKAMGFSLVARHRSKDVQLWRQGGINFIANYEPRSPAAYFAAEHGPSACGMGFRVRDAASAYATVLERGAEPVELATGPMELRLPAIRSNAGSRTPFSGAQNSRNSKPSRPSGFSNRSDIVSHVTLSGRTGKAGGRTDGACG